MTREGALEAVRLHGKRFRTAHLDVRYVASPLRHPRAGIIVPRHSHSAVDRNRVKRRIREIVRLDMLPALPNVDMVVRALPSAYMARVAELREECVRACDRIRGDS